MRTALAARVTIRRRPNATRASYESSSQNVALEVALATPRRRFDARLGRLRRQLPRGRPCAGRLGRARLARCVDAEHAPVSRDPEPEDRALLTEAWRTRSDGYERHLVRTGALLLLSTRAGSPDVLSLILDALRSDDGRHRRFIIDALADITGYDARRDANGVERPLAEVAAEYWRECGGR
jgi:hypothetical protein